MSRKIISTSAAPAAIVEASTTTASNDEHPGRHAA